MILVISGLKVTIITVSFNSGNTIEATIKSVLSQSYKNIEYIIVDGASIDSTAKIVAKYKKKIAIFVSKKDKGLYDAMNKGARLSSGDLVYFLNADDVLKDNKVIENIVRAFEKGIDFIYGDIEMYYPEENIYVRASRKASIKELANGNMPPHQGSFIKRTVLLKNPFDIHYKSSADFDFFCRILKKGAVGKKLNIVVATMRMGGISSGKISYLETEHAVLLYFGIFSFCKIVIKHKVFFVAKILTNVIGLKVHLG